MHNPRESVLVGARISNEIKETMSEYCLNHGIKMNYFVSEAIKEKLLEIFENGQDIAIAKERLGNAEFVSQKKFSEYLLKRGIKS